MTKLTLAVVLSLVSTLSLAQKEEKEVPPGRMSPELLWRLGRVSAVGLTKDGKQLIYTISTPDWQANKSNRKSYMMPVDGGTATIINNPDSLIANKNVSVDGKYKLINKEVKLKNVTGVDIYPELSKSNVLIYDDLNYRHWDTWEDGKYDHVFLATLDVSGKIISEILLKTVRDMM
jgi:hypothetical protein